VIAVAAQRLQRTSGKTRFAAFDTRTTGAMSHRTHGANFVARAHAHGPRGNVVKISASRMISIPILALSISSLSRSMPLLCLSAQTAEQYFLGLIDRNDLLQCAQIAI
jgi:hypothetical protein